MGLLGADLAQKSLLTRSGFVHLVMRSSQVRTLFLKALALIGGGFSVLDTSDSGFMDHST